MGLCQSKADPDGISEFCACKKCGDQRRKLARIKQLQAVSSNISFTTASTAPERKILELKASKKELSDAFAHFKTTDTTQATLAAKDRVLCAKQSLELARKSCEEGRSAPQVGWRDSHDEGEISQVHEVPKRCPSRPSGSKVQLQIHKRRPSSSASFARRVKGPPVILRHIPRTPS